MSINPTLEVDQCFLILTDLVQKTAYLPEADREQITPNIERLQNCLDHLTQSLHERERLRQQNEARFQIMADSSPLMTWMSDAQGCNLYINKTYQKWIGISPEEARQF